MVKLTAELIADSPQFINPVLDRELNLRGWKIPVIENVGVTNNQFDTIDLTDNDIKRLENFPVFPRLKCLMLSNNRVSYIAPDISKYLPSLKTLVLVNNNVQELGDLEPLKLCAKLTHLSLMGNPVVHKQHYRLFVIHYLPHVRVLDFRRVKLKERDAAKALFKGKKGAALKNQLAATKSTVTKTFTPGEMATEESSAVTSAIAKNAEEIAKIKAAIANAKTLYEVEHLQQLLASGQPLPNPDEPVPSQQQQQPGGDQEIEVEEEEETPAAVQPMETTEQQQQQNGS